MGRIKKKKAKQSTKKADKETSAVSVAEDNVQGQGSSSTSSAFTKLSQLSGKPNHDVRVLPVPQNITKNYIYRLAEYFGSLDTIRDLIASEFLDYCGDRIDVPFYEMMYITFPEFGGNRAHEKKLPHRAIRDVRHDIIIRLVPKFSKQYMDHLPASLRRKLAVRTEDTEEQSPSTSDSPDDIQELSDSLTDLESDVDIENENEEKIDKIARVKKPATEVIVEDIVEISDSLDSVSVSNKPTAHKTFHQSMKCNWTVWKPKPIRVKEKQ